MRFISVTLVAPTTQIERDQAAKALRQLAHRVRNGEPLPEDLANAQGIIIGACAVSGNPEEKS